MVDNIVFTTLRTGRHGDGLQGLCQRQGDRQHCRETVSRLSAPEASAVYYVVPQISVDGTTVAGTAQRRERGP